MTAIYKRELKSYFQSMTGYVLIAFLVIFTGIYFMAYNLNSGYPYFSYVLMNINYVLIIIIPMLTMRSFAEERKNKTDQLLLAAPVKLFDIVMGKYLAMVTVFAVPCLIFCIFPIIIKSFGTAYLKVDYLSILMFFLPKKHLHTYYKVQQYAMPILLAVLVLVPAILPQLNIVGWYMDVTAGNLFDLLYSWM